MTILMRPIFVPIGEVKTLNKPLPVLVSTEWHRTIEQLVQAVNDLQAEVDALDGTYAAGDVVIAESASGLVLRDSADHYWRVQVGTDGILSTTDLGTAL